MKLKRRVATLVAASVVAVIGIGASPAAAGAPTEVDGVGVTKANQLFVFDSQRPDFAEVLGPITGLGGQRLVGVDFRPSDDKLYGVTRDGGIYTISETRTATFFAQISVPLEGRNFGVDVNPVVDRLRVVGFESRQSLSISLGAPSTDAPGTAVVNGDLGYPSPGQGQGGASVPAVAYSNNVSGATSTTLYDIEKRRQALTTQDPATGRLTEVGPTGVRINKRAAFDIDAEGDAVAVIQTAGKRGTVYTVDLATGALSSTGRLGDGITKIRGMSLLESPTSSGLGCSPWDPRC